jgi:hypothetical protein
MVLNIVTENFRTIKTSTRITQKQSNIIESSIIQTEENLKNKKKSRGQMINSDQYGILLEAAKSMLQTTRNCSLPVAPIQQ